MTIASRRDTSEHEMQQVFCLATNEPAPTIRVYRHPSTWEACRCRVCSVTLSRLDWNAFTDFMDHFASAHFNCGTFAMDVSQLPLKAQPRPMLPPGYRFAYDPAAVGRLLLEGDERADGRHAITSGLTEQPA